MPTSLLHRVEIRPPLFNLIGSSWIADIGFLLETSCLKRSLEYHFEALTQAKRQDSGGPLQMFVHIHLSDPEKMRQHDVIKPL